MNLEVDSGDVVKLMMQFMKENGLSKSLAALQEETKVSLNTVTSMDRFKADIKHGRWDKVIDVVRNLQVPARKLVALYEQIIIELAELREMEMARQILRQTPVMKALKRETPERYVRLEQILQRPYFDASIAYPGGTNKEQQREDLISMFENEVEVVPASRLTTLLTNALKWQRHLGNLPRGGGCFDLFLGQVPQATTREDERYPRKNSRRIKFGKKSHPEVARFTPDGNYLVSGSVDGFVEVWDYETGKLAQDLKYQASDDFMLHDDSVISLAFTRDSHIIASGDVAGNIKIWRLSSGSCLRKYLKAHESGVSSLEFIPDGTQLLSSSFDGTVKVHGLKSGRMLKEFRGHTSYVNYACFADDYCDQIYSAGSDGAIKVWDAKTTDLLQTINLSENLPSPIAVLSLKLIPKVKNNMLVCSRTNSLKQIDLTGEIIRQYESSGIESELIAFTRSPRGKYIYALGSDMILYCFDAKSGHLEHAIKTHKKEVIGVVHHPHRNILATFSHDGSVKIWKP